MTRQHITGLRVLTAIALMLFGQTALAQTSPTAAQLLALRNLDARVATIGYRLAMANAALCGRRHALSGFMLHDASQYGGDYRETAARTFDLGQGPSILAVAADSAAAQAGVRPDDRLLSVDGQSFPESAETEKGSFDTVQSALTIVETAFADGEADLTLSRGGQAVTVEVTAEEGCASRFQTVPGSRFGASADGQYVQVTSNLVERVTDDAELAAVLAHELAHNILKHRARLDEANVSRGILREFGRNAGLIRTTEIEADLLSVYLLDRAGYPPEAAARFWERFGPQQPWGIFGSATHPDWRRRAAALREEIDRLYAQRRAEAAESRRTMPEQGGGDGANDAASAPVNR